MDEQSEREEPRQTVWEVVAYRFDLPDQFRYGPFAMPADATACVIAAARNPSVISAWMQPIKRKPTLSAEAMRELFLKKTQYKERNRGRDDADV